MTGQRRHRPQQEGAAARCAPFGLGVYCSPPTRTHTDRRPPSCHITPSTNTTTQAPLPVVGSIGNPQRPTLIQDLVKLLYESEDPLWELVRFEAETSAAQDEKVRVWSRVM